MHKADTLAERLRRHQPDSDQSYDPARSTLPLSDAGLFGSFRLPDSIEERYDALDVLGKGAFGIVFQARDMRIGRLTAIKQLYRKHRSVIGREDFDCNHKFRIPDQLLEPCGGSLKHTGK